jgi:hypothetical protein
VALVYPHATISPTKQEAIDAWLPTQPWWDGAGREAVAAFRFDDPDGEVGMEGHLLAAPDVATIFVPLTYRAAPLEGAEAHLVCEMAHSELGPRWVYDAAADPVFVAAATLAITTGGTGALREHVGASGALESGPTTAQVVGSGVASSGALVVARVVGSLAGPSALTATWPGGAGVVAVLQA